MKEYNKVFGFAIIGTGAIASIHAQAIQAVTSAKLLGVYNITPAKAEVFALQYHCKACSSIDDLLKIEELDIVCICTPSGAHLESALKAITAGKHCLIEKPLEVTLDKIDKLIHAAQLNHVIISAVFPSRFYPGNNHLKKAIDAGRFGKMVMGSAYVKWNRSAEYYRSGKWRGTWGLDGGGALMNQAIHVVDILQWCMGPVESVFAYTGNIKHTSIEVEDTAIALLRFTNGALGTIECSTAVYPGTLKRLEIMGTEGTAIVENDNIIQWQFEYPANDDEEIRAASLSNASEGGVSNPLSISYMGHLEQIEDMIQAIRTGRKPLVDEFDGRKSVEIILAIYKSAQIGQPIRLPL
ncbi:Gfo/Idh/MocA family oxidoreductase [Pedobacter sp. BS3]|uniref:Gfo/Idh/MocA family protein n=1 Tax=Pedobacter sp. BS3 TaxID=2567937 RepID=UPI0011ECAA06|nr:Gfo/Idh/MocA family oxidoreductase [Pedobacter sp. BS3]TZF81443.1 Gfo/Idh/MocA family oxidoreductase [Pedobacter sp. BS3]